MTRLCYRCRNDMTQNPYVLHIGWGGEGRTTTDDRIYLCAGCYGKLMDIYLRFIEMADLTRVSEEAEPAKPVCSPQGNAYQDSVYGQIDAGTYSLNKG